MSDNPLADNPERESRIRVRAYLLWEADGCPDGRDAEFWERARELVAIEDHPEAGRLPLPETVTVAPDAGAEDAAVQANLGEIPGRLTDQGDRAQTPKPRRTRKKK
jgi:hypothetical protein